MSTAQLIDVNVTLSRYPFRRLPLDEPQKLVAKLTTLGITQAWASSFDALLHRDIAGVNLRLANDCKTHGDHFLIPFGAVNPTLPDWQDDIRRCAEVHGFLGLRLYPTYHGYKLGDPIFTDLLTEAHRRNLIIQIVDHIEDERTHHPLLRIPPVEWGPLAKIIPQFPDTKFVLLNAVRIARGEPLQSLTKFPNVYVDIASLEAVGGIRNVLERFPAERICFGTHAPFYYPESAVLKLTESAIEGDLLTRIGSANASTLLKG